MSGKLQTSAKANSSDTAAVSGVLQRQCACGTHTIAGSHCELCQIEKTSPQLLQHAAPGAGPVNDVPEIVHEVLRSSGQPLDAELRSLFEPRFDHDFSHVRVHTDGKAAESARDVGSMAYTVGRNVVFGVGQYAPRSLAGQRLLAHELAHVVQQGEASGSLFSKKDNETSYNALEEDADQAAARVVTTLTDGAHAGMGKLAEKTMPRMKSGFSLQRQPCKKADDKIITGPLKMELPKIKCEPKGETLATVRAVPGVPQTILGVTHPDAGNLSISYDEEKAGRCRAIVKSQYELTFAEFMYVKAGTYEDGTEEIPKGRPCPEGKRIRKRLLVSPLMAQKLKEGEAEHCEDSKLAFALSQGKYNEAIKDLAGGEYCPGGPKAPECQKEFQNRFQDRTGIAFDDQVTIGECLHGKSKIRDDKGWHDVKTDRPGEIYGEAYAPDCNLVTHILNPDLSPDISKEKHPSSSIIKDCGEK